MTALCLHNIKGFHLQLSNSKTRLESLKFSNFGIRRKVFKQMCKLGVNAQWQKAFSAVRSTHHVSKQIKTMSKYFSVQSIFGNGCLNLRDLNGLNFPPKNSHIAQIQKKILKKKSFLFLWCSG